MLEGIGDLSLLAVTVSVSTLVLVASASYSVGRRSVLGAADSRPAEAPGDRSAAAATSAAAASAAAFERCAPSETVAGIVHAAAAPAAEPQPAPRADPVRSERVAAARAQIEMFEAGRPAAAAVGAVEHIVPQRRPRVINDQLACERFLAFLRAVADRKLSPEDADDITYSAADDGSLAVMEALLADPTLCVDWMRPAELAEIYVAWARIKGYVPMAEGALIPEIVAFPGVSRERRRLKGAAFVRVRDRHAARGDDIERATLVRVWSTDEMDARARSRAGSAREARDRTVARWAGSAAAAA